MTSFQENSHYILSFHSNQRLSNRIDVGWSHIVLGRINFEDEFHFQIVTFVFPFSIFLLERFGFISLVVLFLTDWYWETLVMYQSNIANSTTQLQKICTRIPSWYIVVKQFHLLLFFSQCILFLFQLSQCKGNQTILDHSALLYLMLQYVWFP